MFSSLRSRTAVTQGPRANLWADTQCWPTASARASARQRLVWARLGPGPRSTPAAQDWRLGRADLSKPVRSAASALIRSQTCGRLHVFKRLPSLEHRNRIPRGCVRPGQIQAGAGVYWKRCAWNGQHLPKRDQAMVHHVDIPFLAQNLTRDLHVRSLHQFGHNFQSRRRRVESGREWRRVFLEDYVLGEGVVFPNLKEIGLDSIKRGSVENLVRRDEFAWHRSLDGAKDDALAAGHVGQVDGAQAPLHPLGVRSKDVEGRWHIQL